MADALIAARWKDIELSGLHPDQPDILEIETTWDHRIAARQFLLNFIPEDSIGVELGVFTGLFSSLLAREQKCKRVTFVDPYWTSYGEYFPAWWDEFSLHGKLKTRHCYEIAKRRIESANLEGRSIEVMTSQAWLGKQPNGSLDWAYIDSSHTYRGTMDELDLLAKKLSTNGVVIGDDWHFDPVYCAVNDFLKRNDFDLIFADVRLQWMLRRSYARTLDPEAAYEIRLKERISHWHVLPFGDAQVRTRIAGRQL